MANIIKLKRGLEQNLNSNLLQDGELAITTDENNLYSSKGKINRQNVFVGSSEPDDPNIDVWINPQGSDYIVDKIYPIGSIYLSVNNTSPSILFGGEWEQIKDRFLLACGDTYNNGVTGGEAEHILTPSELAYHDHMGRNYSHNWNAGVSIPAGRSYAVSYGTEGGQWAYSAGNIINNSEINDMVETGGRGGNQPHNNMPPYLAVYIWKRIK